MKKFYLVLALCLSATIGYSQGYYLLPAEDAGFNPGELNEDPEQPAAFLNNNNLGYSTLLTTDTVDEWSPVQSIPFSFDFNGSSQTSYVVSGSGVLTFISAQPSMTPGFTNSALPSSNIMDRSVCVWGQNLTGSNDAIVSKTFGTAPNRQHWVIWASSTVPGLGTGNQWAYWGIVLEETTNSIYIVDMRSYSAAGTSGALTVGIQVDATTAISVPGSPAVSSRTLSTGGGTSDPSDNTFYEFVYGTQPTNDIRLISVSVPPQIANNSANSLEAVVQNRGSASVNSFDYNHDDNQGSSGTTNYSGTLASGSFATIGVSGGWTPTSTGMYSLDLDVSNPNGTADENPNDNSLTYNVDVVDATTRMPLFETFTSSTCGPCRPANANMMGLFANNGRDYVSVKYQVNWPGNGDPYYTNEVMGRRSYYGINAVPTVQINGGWGGNGNVLNQQVFDEYKNELAFVEMSSEFEVDATTQTVSGTVKIKPLSNVTGANLFIAIVETRTVNNVKSNGETEFFNVMKKMVPGENGDPLGSLAADVEITKNFSYTFNGNYTLPPDANSPVNHATAHTVESWNALGLAVWVQNPSDGKVLQAARGDRTNFVSNEEYIPSQASIFPNPANDELNIELEEGKQLSVEISDLSGKIVINKDFGLTENAKLNTAGLKAGMYIVKVITDGTTSSERISILH